MENPPRWGEPQQYVGKKIIEVREHKTPDGDRLVIVFEDTEHYLDIRAEELFY
jgi:hypothetical protein